MLKIIGIGNALVDVLIKLDNNNLLEKFSLPKGSMQLVDTDFVKRLTEATKNINKQLASGGSAANTIHGLANLGIDSAYIGKIGQDDFGKFFTDDLKNSNINPKLFFSKTETGQANTLISKDGERTFATYLGAAVELNANDLSMELLNGYNYFHIEGYLVFNHELLLKVAELAKQKKMIISLDLASYNVVEANLDFLKDFVKKYVDILFANEEEAKAFTGKEPVAALNEISEICHIAVVKIGDKGSLIKSENEMHKVNIIPVECIDTTGAGDLYASGFLYGLMKRLPLNKCGEIGAILSGNVIEVIGAKMEKKRWQKVNESVNAVMNQDKYDS